MDKDEILKKVEDLSAENLAEYIREGKVTLTELGETQNLVSSKRKAIRKKVDEYAKEDFNAAMVIGTIEALEAFILKHTNDTDYVNKAKENIAQIKKNINDDNEKKGREAEVFKEVMNEAESVLESVKNSEVNFPDSVTKTAAALQRLDNFKINYSSSTHINEVDEKISKMESFAFDEAVKNINARTPYEAKTMYNGSFLREVCRRIGIDYNLVVDFKAPPGLDNNDIVPQNLDEIPSGFTDVFFWGIKSSGKSCALAAILNTINSPEYIMGVPTHIKKPFGAKYRKNLMEIFSRSGGVGYLPNPTPTEKTQYMPFLIKKNVKEKYKNVSFFELSGEIFKKFEEEIYGIKDNSDEGKFALKTLNLLLESDNQKVHFFFIDYDQAVEHTLEQIESLKAAAAYFSKYNHVFEKKTDAVYVVVTKADKIEASNENERYKLAIEFLHKNFGNFLGVLKTHCEDHCIRKYDEMIFSIGDVYFSKICKINRSYSKTIIDKLLEIIEPPRSGIRATLDKIFNDS